LSLLAGVSGVAGQGPTGEAKLPASWSVAEPGPALFGPELRWVGGLERSVGPAVADAGIDRGSVLPPVLSFVVPGTGQLLQQQKRGWVYMAAEAVGWVVYVDRRRSAGRYRDAYRDLAWETARLAEGPRIDGDFTYYERLTQWTRSGGFDRDAVTPGIQPETDPTTFNGAIWDRAARIFGVSPTAPDPAEPGYAAALEYYEERAYGDTFLWDWSEHPGEIGRFGALIRASDERYQRATIALGMLFANHLISAVDAFVSVRGLSLEIAPMPSGEGIGMRGEWRP
jgi:hypothetical protein